MSESTEVAPAGNNLPVLAPTPAYDLDSSDVSLPRLYLAQDMSGAVQEGNADKGDIYAATGGEDPDPEILYVAKDEGEGVLFHVIGVNKALSGKDENDEFQTWPWGDPDAPKDAWKTYHYTVVCPEVEQSVPFKISWSRSQTPAAKVVNTALAKAAQNGIPPHEIAFRLTTFQKSNPKAKGTYTVPRVVTVEAKDADKKLAEGLANSFNGASQVDVSTGDEPAI